MKIDQVLRVRCLFFKRGELEVITMIVYPKVRRMYFREKHSIRGIARKTSHSRNTLKKWLREREAKQS